MNDEDPKSLQYEDVRRRRLDAIHATHVEPLTEYVHGLHKRGFGEVPYFDPLDGGVKARILFLFEKPGPKTSVEGGGSGFISRNNNDETAAATFAFMAQAGIARKDTVIWNAIPGWNGTIKITAVEASAGAELLRDLMQYRLSNVHVVVLVGERARRAWERFGPSGFDVIHSPHPSPVVRASRPQLWQSIPGIWASAKAFLD